MGLHYHPPPPATPTTPWDIVRHGERVLPPDKVWTLDLVPAHTHEHFHPSSWTPLKYRRLAWHKWLFGLQTRSGFSHYASYWKDELPTSACGHCGSRHNASVHGVLAYCEPSHPLVQAWLTSWPNPRLLQQWRSTALRRDLRIIGRLAIPRTLYQLLYRVQGGSRAARKAVGQLQRRVLDSVTSVLSTAVPPPL